MGTPTSVTTLEVSHVAPFTDTSDSIAEFSLPLTFFDTFWFKQSPVEYLFFYSFPETKDSSNSVLPKLKFSLSLTLTFFLSLAGNLTWPKDSSKPIILYTPGKAVSVSIAESDSDFDLLAGNHARQASASHSLVPVLQVSETGASALALQITVFPNRGFCIGVTTHHAVVDGKSSAMFMKSWAYLCKENPPLLPELTPFYDRSVIRDPSGVDILYSNMRARATGMSLSSFRNDPKLFEFTRSSDVPSDLNIATFELTRSDIEKLRQGVSSTWDKVVILSPKPKLHLSSFVLTFAYVLDCILKATDGDESKRKVYFGFNADYRSRLEPPVPENYFGNCVGLRSNHEEVREKLFGHEEDSLSALAAKISGVVTALKKDIDVRREAEEWTSRVASMAAEKPYGVGVAGSNKFGFYSTDFGWGRPEKVEMVSIRKTGAIFMVESRDGSGGVEVCLALNKHQMDLFSTLFATGLNNL